MRGFRRPLGLIVLASLVIRVLYTVLIGRHATGVGDYFYYHGIANLLADGRGFVDPFLTTEQRPYPSALHPPAWPVLLALASKLGVTTELGHRLVGCVVGAAVVGLVGLLGRRVAGPRAGLIAAGLAALYPTLIAADGSLMSETLYGLFVALALLAAYRVLDRPEPISALLLGAAVALAALTRGEALLLVPLLVLPVCLWSGPGRLGRLAVAVLATVVLLAPWAVRNWVTFDRPVLISTNESTLTAGANCASVYGGTDVGFWHLQCISKRRPGLNEAEQASVWRDEGTGYATDHLGRLVFPVVPARVLRTWDLLHPRAQARRAEGRSRTVTLLGTLCLYPLVALAIAGGVLLRRRGRVVWILAVPIVLVTVSSVLGFGLPRFRHAAEIALVPLAAVAIDQLLTRFRGPAAPEGRARPQPPPAQARPAAPPAA